MSWTVSGPAMTSSDVCGTQVSFVSIAEGGAGMFTGRCRAGGGSMRRLACMGGQRQPTSSLKVSPLKGLPQAAPSGSASSP